MGRVRTLDRTSDGRKLAQPWRVRARGSVVSWQETAFSPLGNHGHVRLPNGVSSLGHLSSFNPVNNGREAISLQRGRTAEKNRANRVLVTGGAGFIGSHLVDRLLCGGWQVTVVDNFDPFYSTAIKEENITRHVRHPSYRLVRADIRDAWSLRNSLAGPYDVIVHLAGKAGVLPSIDDPAGYHAVNVGGTQNLLELAKELSVPQFVFASSSSVYGVNPNVPWHEDEAVLQPISPYAVTKVSGELLGHVYSKLYGIRFVGLRIFTVFGPRQRPDLAIHKFARMMLQGEPIPVYGNGTTRRDYTFVDDIVAGICLAMEYQNSSYEIINLGQGRPVTLTKLIDNLEKVLGVKAKRKLLPEQPGDLPQTFADIAKAQKLLGYEPITGLKEGLESFVSWLKGDYHKACGELV